VAIVYRLANNQDDRLPELAADLARRRVAVIATAGTPSTFAEGCNHDDPHCLHCRR
jgi:hypothetical protein